MRRGKGARECLNNSIEILRCCETASLGTWYDVMRCDWKPVGFDHIPSAAFKYAYEACPRAAVSIASIVEWLFLSLKVT